MKRLKILWLTFMSVCINISIKCLDILYKELKKKVQ